MAERTTGDSGLPRIETGVPGLDRILGGGLVEAGLYLIEGAAGTGKTILSSQIAFYRAARGEKIVFVTLIAESHGKLLEHLSTLEFFDPGALGQRLLLFSAYQALLDAGTHGLLRFLAATLHEHRPALMILDGFGSVRDFSDDRAALARFIHELNALVTATRCTTLLLAHERGRIGQCPEHALVDGLIELTVFPRDMRRGREIEVHKIRASAPLTGVHVFEIDARGAHIYPRLEALVQREAPAPAEIGGPRLGFGLPSLDALIGGGLTADSATSLLGAPGAGKTLLGMQFLAAGVTQGERCLHFGFFESPERLLAKIAAVGMDLRPAVDSGLLRMMWQPPLELYLDELAERLLEVVRTHRIRRLFIDGVEGFAESALHRERLSTFLTALSVELRTARATTILSEELPLFGETIDASESLLSAVVENILLVRYVELDSELHRLLSVLKLRESSFDASIREFTISGRGIEVLSKFESVERTLTGYARRVREPREGAPDALTRSQSEGPP